MRNFLKGPSAVLFAVAALFWCDDARAQVVIDNFDKNQALISGTGSSMVAGTMLGDERDEKLTVSSGIISAEIKKGTYIFTQAAGASGSAEIVWDGTDGNANTIATGGLNNV